LFSAGLCNPQPAEPFCPKVLGFVLPTISNIERLKTVKEFILLNQITNQFLFINIFFYHTLFFHPARQSIPHCQIGPPAKKVAQAWFSASIIKDFSFQLFHE
jgi:hypothetical protein